ncbi:hypothetical protein QR46_4831 [Giardia duodenalis assemblage B]|uniref:Uncharacterized protein n=1 Tax=Giardia duodenalis assemblage B TaxID=1394984 RepID=A0A132NN45_GIAIN|nr:hypothetical protein QR46_4831 [Giardia intestinalis assemblage B]
MLMPASSTGGPRRVWPPSTLTQGRETRGPVRGGAALQEKQTHFNHLLAHQLPDRAATYCLQMRCL